MKTVDDLSIKIKNKELYDQAFTHTSYANEHGLTSYERLEYLGDAVLELVMSEYLYKNMDKEEGEMTKLRAHYVCEAALYEYAMKLGLNEYIKLGNGEEENGGRTRRAIVADVFEAFIGALYLDQGLKSVQKFMNDNIFPMIENGEIISFQDYKSLLQELVQTNRKSLEYKIIKEEGPAHNRVFTAEVIIDNIIYGKGTAHSKKEAEMEAAKDALKKSVRI